MCCDRMATATAFADMAAIRRSEAYLQGVRILCDEACKAVGSFHFSSDLFAAAAALPAAILASKVSRR